MRIPVQYDTITSASEGPAGVYNFSARTSGVWMRNHGYGTVDDEYGITHEFYMHPGAVGTNAFSWYDRATGSAMSGSSGGLYLPTTLSGMSIDVSQADWNWPTSTFPASISFTVATLPTTSASWTNAIFTDASPDMYGVYTTDVDDPSEMPQEFQLALAARLALQGALVHAKSSKLVDRLGQQAATYVNRAIEQSTADEEHFDGATVSTAERARW